MHNSFLLCCLFTLIPLPGQLCRTGPLFPVSSLAIQVKLPRGHVFPSLHTFDALISYKVLQTPTPPILPLFFKTQPSCHFLLESPLTLFFCPASVRNPLNLKKTCVYPPKCSDTVLVVLLYHHAGWQIF